MTWKEGTQSPSCGYQSLVAGKGMTKADKLARKLIIRLQRENRKRSHLWKETRGLRRVTKVFDYIHEVYMFARTNSWFLEDCQA